MEESVNKVNPLASVPSVCHKDDAEACFIRVEVSSISLVMTIQLPRCPEKYREIDLALCSLDGGPSDNDSVPRREEEEED